MHLFPENIRGIIFLATGMKKRRGSFKRSIQVRRNKLLKLERIDLQGPRYKEDLASRNEHNRFSHWFRCTKPYTLYGKSNLVRAVIGNGKQRTFSCRIRIPAFPFQKESR